MSSVSAFCVDRGSGNAGAAPRPPRRADPQAPPGGRRSGRELREERQDLGPDTGAQVTRIPVRVITRGRNRVPLHVCDDRAAPRPEQGTHELEAGLPEGSARRQHREAVRPRPAEKPEQDGLGAVVGMVGGRDRLRAGGARSLGQRRVAFGAGPCLEISPARDPHERARERNPQRSGERLGGVELPSPPRSGDRDRHRAPAAPRRASVRAAPPRGGAPSNPDRRSRRRAAPSPSPAPLRLSTRGERW